jgi:hypothetical protein
VRQSGGFAAGDAAVALKAVARLRKTATAVLAADTRKTSGVQKAAADMGFRSGWNVLAGERILAQD